MLPEQFKKDIDAQSQPKLIILFPEHPKKSTMESYLTRRLRQDQDCDPPGNFDSERYNRYIIQPLLCFSFMLFTASAKLIVEQPIVDE